MGEGSHVHVPAQDAFVDLGGVDHGAAADLAVRNHGVWADLAVLPDDRVSPEDGARQEDGARADGHPGIDVSVGGIQHLYAGALVEHGDLLLGRLLEADQLGDGAEGEHHAANGHDGLPDLLHPAAPGKFGDIPVIVLLGARHGGGLRREAGGDLVNQLAVAYNKKPPDAFFQPCPHTPGQNRAK